MSMAIHECGFNVPEDWDRNDETDYRNDPEWHYGFVKARGRLRVKNNHEERAYQAECKKKEAADEARINVDKWRAIPFDIRDVLGRHDAKFKSLAFLREKGGECYVEASDWLRKKGVESLDDLEECKLIKPFVEMIEWVYVRRCRLAKTLFRASCSYANNELYKEKDFDPNDDPGAVKRAQEMANEEANKKEEKDNMYFDHQLQLLILRYKRKQARQYDSDSD